MHLASKVSLWGLNLQRLCFHLWSLGFKGAELLRELSDNKTIYLNEELWELSLWTSLSRLTLSSSASDQQCPICASLRCPTTLEIQHRTPTHCPFHINCPRKEGPVEPNPSSDAIGWCQSEYYGKASWREVRLSVTVSFWRSQVEEMWKGIDPKSCTLGVPSSEGHSCNLFLLSPFFPLTISEHNPTTSLLPQ